jgi:hypothetical protein
MQDYHKVWIEDRGVDEDYLKAALLSGFDMHHLDGDHENNDPSNLILIHHLDHVMLHKSIPIPQRGLVWHDKEGYVNTKLIRGEKAYKEKASGKMWKDINVKNAQPCAKYFAQKNNLPWPICYKNTDKKQREREEGKLAYSLKKEKPLRWEEIEAYHNIIRPSHKAKAYAVENGLEWPLPRLKLPKNKNRKQHHVQTKCYRCGKQFNKRSSDYNRSERQGKKHFCSERCAAIYGNALR